MAVEKKVTIEDIRQQLESNVGKKYSFALTRAAPLLETEGVLVETYPKLFVVNLDQTNAVRRRSYTYADVLTQNVQITIDDKQVGAH